MASPARRRCSECRRWFRPEASALKSQRSCGRLCRLRRRAADGNRRRRADPEASRVDERARQQTCRARKQAAGVDLSRTGLPSQFAEPIDDFITLLGQAEARSRAALRRHLKRVLAARLVASAIAAVVGGPD